jgi:quercetin dioxygenase-like cupin family protein
VKDNARVRIVRVSADGRKPSAESYPPGGARGPSSDSIFIGEVHVQTLVPDEWTRDLRLIEVHFTGGARNRMHTHSTDQILVITEGTAMVGTRTGDHELAPGDVAFIPAGEEHWHGAKQGHDMTHLAINGHGSATTVTE